MGNIRGALSNEALAAIGACVVLVVVVAMTMRDKKPRFHFDSLVGPASSTAAAATSASTSLASSPAIPSASPDLQALFVQGRAESPLIAPVVDGPLTPPFVTNTDYARPPVYREIGEVDLGKIYASAPKNDKKALGKVARIGGFRSPEAMARAFGYPSVDQMLWTWDQTIATSPQFQAANFGTNSRPPLPWQD
ncbi:MAG: hypothetical protein WCH98_02325 [Verrucomicrobiota bacterium]